MRQNTKKQIKKGQVLLVAVLVIFIAAIALATAAAALALVQNQSISNQKLSDKTYVFATACAEEGLMRVTKGSVNFPEISLSQGATSCTININGSNPSYQLLVIAETQSPLNGTKKVTKKIQVDLSLQNNKTEITSYQEIN